MQLRSAAQHGLEVAVLGLLLLMATGPCIRVCGMRLLHTQVLYEWLTAITKSALFAWASCTH